MFGSYGAGPLVSACDTNEDYSTASAPSSWYARCLPTVSYGHREDGERTINSGLCRLGLGEQWRNTEERHGLPPANEKVSDGAVVQTTHLRHSFFFRSGMDGHGIRHASYHIFRGIVEEIGLAKDKRCDEVV